MPLSYSYRVVIDQDGHRKVTERYEDRTDQNKVAADDDGPLIDVLDQEDKVRVIMHVPGASREDIDLEFKDRSLMVKVENASRSMMREVPLPCAVVPSSAIAECHNGVLEVCLLKDTERRRKRKALKAE
jgi:HSP20 family protein